MHADQSEAVDFLESLSGAPLTIGRTLASTRRSDGYTTAGMAAKLGIAPRHLRELEYGLRRATPGEARRWAEALGYCGDTWERMAAEEGNP